MVHNELPAKWNLNKSQSLVNCIGREKYWCYNMSWCWAELSRALDSPPKKTQTKSKKNPKKPQKPNKQQKTNPKPLMSSLLCKPKTVQVKVYMKQWDRWRWERIAITCYFPPCFLLAVLGAAGLHSNFDTARFIIKMHTILPFLLGSFSPIKTSECKFLVVH